MKRSGLTTVRFTAVSVLAGLLVVLLPVDLGAGVMPDDPSPVTEPEPAWSSTGSAQGAEAAEGHRTEVDEVVVAHDDPVELSWRALAALDFRTGEMSDQLRDLVGKSVKIPGFTVPLEDFASSATEFLLVPYVGACVHTPPPPPNQLVYVEMDEGKRATMDGWNPVWLEGILHIEDVNSVYGSSSYRVVGVSVRPYS